MKAINYIVLAAGQGSRMNTILPKVLHKIAGRTLIDIVLSKLSYSSSKYLVISPFIHDNYFSYLNNINDSVKLIIQKEALGSGNAVLEASRLINKDNDVTLIVYADTPLIEESSLNKLIMLCETKYEAMVMGFAVSDSSLPYGRIVMAKDDDIDKHTEVREISGIVEYHHADEMLRKSVYCNSGVMAIRTHILLEFIEQLSIREVAGKQECYLTDIVSALSQNGRKCASLVLHEDELRGVNNLQELSAVEEIIQNKIRNKWQKQGVRIINPYSVYFSYDTMIGRNSVIGQNVVFGDNVDIGANSNIGSNCEISDFSCGENTVIESNVIIKKGVKLGTGCIVYSFSYVEDLIAMNNIKIGPFARVRGKTFIDSHSKVGNFVEIKNSTLHSDVKTSHLAYLGDSEIGSKSNIGAGVITCNYDGYNKNRTTIGKRAFVGASTTFIAPVKIGDDCLVAAGSVITTEVLDGDLAISRAKQINKAAGAKKYKLKHVKS